MPTPAAAVLTKSRRDKLFLSSGSRFMSVPQIAIWASLFGATLIQDAYFDSTGDQESGISRFDLPLGAEL